MKMKLAAGSTKWIRTQNGLKILNALEIPTTLFSFPARTVTIIIFASMEYHVLWNAAKVSIGISKATIVTIHIRLDAM